MQVRPEVKRVQMIYEQNQELKAQIKRIEANMEENDKRIITEFFPYLLSVYAGWRPYLGEKAIQIYFELNICFAVTILEVDGYRVRAQEGQKTVYHNFMLNPVLFCEISVDRKPLGGDRQIPDPPSGIWRSPPSG